MNNNISTIRLTPDGFSLYDIVSGLECVDIAPGSDFSQRLEEAILDKLPTDQQRDGLRCEVETSRLLLLPPDINDDALQHQMFNVCFSAPAEDEQIVVQRLTLPSGQEVQMCFSLTRTIYNFLLRNYEEVTFSHPIATLLTEGCRMAQGNCMIVRCDDHYLELALFRDKQLQLVNTYHTSHPENRTYYVMNTWQQLGLDQLSDYLLVLGGTNAGLQVRASAHRFIKHVFSSDI